VKKQLGEAAEGLPSYCIEDKRSSNWVKKENRVAIVVHEAGKGQQR